MTLNRKIQGAYEAGYAWSFIDVGFYEDLKTGKVLIVLGPGKIYSGRVIIKKKKYKYYRYRCGKKIVDVYVGRVGLSAEGG